MNKTKRSSKYLSRPVVQALHGEVTGFSAAVPTFYSPEREQKTTFAAAASVPARSLPQGVFAGTTALGGVGGSEAELPALGEAGCVSSG